MRKISLVIINILVIFLFFGFANSSLALTGFTEVPTIVYPPPDGTDIPLNPTLQWSKPWTGSDTSYVPEDYEIWYQWAIGTTPINTSTGVGNLDYSGDSPLTSNKLVKHPTTTLTLSYTLTPATTYYWAVRARRYYIIDIFGNRNLVDSSGWSEYGVFTTLGIKPPIITSPPVPNYSKFDPTSSITWTPDTTGVTPEVYGWELWTGDNKTKIKSGSTQGTSISPSSGNYTLDYSTSYTFKVKAGIKCGTTVDITKCIVITDWVTRTFTTKPIATVDPPILTSPVGEVSVPFNLQWQKATSAQTYQWEIREKTTGLIACNNFGVDKCGAPTVQPCTGSTDQLCVNIASGLSIGTSYLWTAKSCWTTAGGIQNCSNFRDPSNEILVKAITTPAPTVTLTAEPTQLTATGTVKLSWTSANATTLTIDQGVGNVTSIAEHYKNVSIAQTTTFTITAVGTGGSKTAKVTVSVGTTPALSAPTNLSPCGGAKDISITPTLSWSDVKASYYQVSISDVPIGFETTKNLVEIKDPSLELGKAYTWYVRACSSPANCKQSESCTFTTASTAVAPPSGAPSVPVNLSPSGSGVSVSSSLSWQLPSGQSLPSGGFFIVRLLDISDEYYPVVLMDDYKAFGNSVNQGDTTFRLSPNTPYYLMVKTCKTENECSTSATAAFTTPAAPGGTPGGTPGSILRPTVCATKTCGPNEICNPLCAENIQDLINIIINLIYWVALAIAPIMIIVGAFYFLTSAGDPNRWGTGKKIIIYTLIGLAIVLFAKGIISVIRNVLGG